MREGHFSVVVSIDALPESEMERQVSQYKHRHIGWSADHNILRYLPSICQEITLNEIYINQGLGNACKYIT